MKVVDAILSAYAESWFLYANAVNKKNSVTVDLYDELHFHLV